MLDQCRDGLEGHNGVFDSLMSVGLFDHGALFSSLSRGDVAIFAGMLMTIMGATASKDWRGKQRKQKLGGRVMTHARQDRRQYTCRRQGG